MTANITNATNAVVVWQDAENLVTNLAIDNGFVTFDVSKANIVQGNALIAARDASNNILWSWHIWVTPESVFNVANPQYDEIENRTVTVSNPAQSTTKRTYKFMRYNLGYASPTETDFPLRTVKVRITQTGLEAAFNPKSVEITLTQTAGKEETAANNPHFQWGRKDPFPPSNGINNIERTMFWGAGYSYQTSAPTGPAENIAVTIANPHKFYTGLVNDYNWVKDPDYHDLWALNNSATGANTYSIDTVVKTIYDPSPAGFHLPPSNAFRGFTFSGNNQTISGSQAYGDYFNVAGPFNRGWTFYTTAFNQGDTKSGATVFFPASGSRNWETGASSGVNSRGYWWSALPYSTTYGYTLGFNSTTVDPLAINYRSYGFSIRSVME